MPVVTETIHAPGGGVQAGILIEITPSPNGWYSADGHLIQGCTRVRTDDTGTWSATLETNVGSDPTPSYYTITRHITCAGCGSLETVDVQVPNTAGPHQVEDIAVAGISVPPFFLSDELPLAIAAVADEGTCIRASRCDHVHPYTGLATDAELAAAVAVETAARVADVDAEEAARIAADAAEAAARAAADTAHITDASDPHSAAVITWTNEHNFEDDVFFSSGRPWVDADAKEFDVAADDRARLTLAVAAIPAAGGILLLGPRTYTASHATEPILKIQDRNGIKVWCAGRGATVIQQTGAGPVVQILGTVSVTGVTLQDVKIDGNGTAGVGITLTNAKHCNVKRFQVDACEGDGVLLNGGATLHCAIEDGEISTATTPSAAARAMRWSGGTSCVASRVYFAGGGGALNYRVLWDVRGHDGASSSGCIFEGEAPDNMIQIDGSYTEEANWYDVSGLTGAYVWDWQANNHLSIYSPRGSIGRNHINTTGRDLRYLTFLPQSNAAQGIGQIGNLIAGYGFAAAQITADQNDYAPNGINYADYVRITSDAARTITGIDANGAPEGRRLVLHNGGGFTITLAINDGASAAANRIVAQYASDTQTYRLRPDGMLYLVYGNSRWRIVDNAAFPIIPTASLPAAGATMDGAILIEDGGAGNQNLIIYGNAQRFRIDGGAAF